MDQQSAHRNTSPGLADPLPDTRLPEQGQTADLLAFGLTLLGTRSSYRACASSPPSLVVDITLKVIYPPRALSPMGSQAAPSPGALARAPSASIPCLRISR
jgi:hypothetical protein